MKARRGVGVGMSDKFLFGGISAEINGWMEKRLEDGGCEKCVEDE